MPSIFDWMSDTLNFLVNPGRFLEVIFELNVKGYEWIKELNERESI